MHRSGVLCGTAVTVKTRPGDNLMVHRALDIALPGDAVVVDGSGDLTNALIGELMAMYAKTRGLAGIVINGSIRDAGAIREMDFPVYAAGVTHRGPYKDGPGEINVPISLDGMVINPGDLVLGDHDGIVCVAARDTNWVLQAAQKKVSAEMVDRRAIQDGCYDRKWIEEKLQKLGCPGL